METKNKLDLIRSINLAYDSHHIDDEHAANLVMCQISALTFCGIFKLLSQIVRKMRYLKDNSMGVYSKKNRDWYPVFDEFFDSISMAYRYDVKDAAITAICHSFMKILCGYEFMYHSECLASEVKRASMTFKPLIANRNIPYVYTEYSVDGKILLETDVQMASIHEHGEFVPSDNGGHASIFRNVKISFGVEIMNIYGDGGSSVIVNLMEPKFAHYIAWEGYSVYIFKDFPFRVLFNKIKDYVKKNEDKYVDFLRIIWLDLLNYGGNPTAMNIIELSEKLIDLYGSLHKPNIPDCVYDSKITIPHLNAFMKMCYKAARAHLDYDL